MKNSHLAFAALALSFSIATQAQIYHPNKGTEFWCAFLENPKISNWDTCLQAIRIYSDSLTTGQVEAPLLGISLPFTVPAGGSIQVMLPACLTSMGSGIITPFGIHISAQDSIRAEAVFYQKIASESTVLLPSWMLSGRIHAMTFTGSGANQVAVLVVVATEDSTLVEIIPANDLLGGNPFTTLLNRGETLQLQAPGDLTGTVVQSQNDKPIAVFQGNTQASIGDCWEAESHHLYEQALPDPPDFAGRHYYFVPFKGQRKNYVKIMALEDGARFTRNCDTSGVTLNRGESVLEILDSATIISANRKIAVTHFNSSQKCNPTAEGSPAMLQLPPGNFQTRRAAFQTPDTLNPQTGFNYFDQFFINVAVVVGDTADFWLDGADIGNAFRCEASGLCFAQIEVSPGYHLLTADSSFFTATAYGFGNDDGFAHALGYDWFLPRCVHVGICSPQNQTVCIGDTVSFSHCSEIPLEHCFWDFGNGDTTSTPSPQYVFDSAGTYEISYLAVTPDGCMMYSASVEIIVVDCCDTTFAPDIQVDGALCVDSIALLTAVADSIPNEWIWVLPTGDTLPLVNQFVYLFEAEGEYEFFLFAKYSTDCVLSDSLILSVEDCAQRDNCLKMPNIFTPNQDGVNDTFRPALACEVGDFSMKIFNRWGGVVFEGNDSKSGWDGGQAASDVYVWMIEYAENEAGKIKMAGEVTLVR